MVIGFAGIGSIPLIFVHGAKAERHIVRSQVPQRVLDGRVHGVAELSLNLTSCEREERSDMIKSLREDNACAWLVEKLLGLGVELRKGALFRPITRDGNDGMLIEHKRSLIQRNPGTKSG